MEYCYSPIIQSHLSAGGYDMKPTCYVSMARSARLERVLNDGYAVCSAPGVEANWYAVDE
jgi:nucleosome binding factor SPN SPT16 subunit